jgi:hypothetical protein
MLLMMGLAVAPLLTGSGTLYTRDVLTTHYPLKVAQAEFLRRGEIPLIDPYRAGGQPLVGNPNALPLYPDNLLYLVASPLWALNAHFWLHWLLAPLAFSWLGRAWGLSWRASWAAGVCYAGSGFFLSLLNLYNLVAGAVLTPAFIAAVLGAWQLRPPRYGRALVGLLWGLLLLAGDPFFAALALILAVTAALFRPPRSQEVLPDGRHPVWGVATGVGLGTLLALPMLVEFLRILPLSFRGYWHYSVETALTQSWDPRTAVEWLLPFFFGRPDFSFWGQSFFGGNPPLLYSLFPGILCLLLVATSGWSRRATLLWPWATVVVGGFFALGAWNPLIPLLYKLPGASSFRYPVKFWLAVAVGSALLCGLGFERLFQPGGPQRLGRAMGLLFLVYLGLWIVLNTQGEVIHARLTSWSPGRLSGAFFELERQRWSGLCLLALGNLIVLALALWLLRRRPGIGSALLLMVHLGAQLYFLAPLYHADRAEPFLTPPPALGAVPEGARVVHGGFSQLFGRLSPAVLGSFADSRFFWLARHQFANLHPFAGVQWGLVYDFNLSPEGLDTFYTHALARKMRNKPDPYRLAMLRASGVDVLLLHRPLTPDTQGAVRLRATLPSVGENLYVYEILGSASPVQLVGSVRRAPHLDAALDLLANPTFNPQTMVVLPNRGATAETENPPGTAEILAESTDSLEVLVDSAGGGVLTTRRAFLATYLATIDGHPVSPQVANIHRLAVEVPAGQHQVRFWVDRRFFQGGVLFAILGLLGLLWTTRRGPETKI